MVNAASGYRYSRSLNLETFALILRKNSAPGEHHAYSPSRLAPANGSVLSGGGWTVSKSSGEVWLTSTGAQPASLKQEEFLKPGDTIRTGRTGRVLLQRGEESMMISPNSVVGVPSEKKEGLSTTIVQQAGSILLEFEKRNVKHFEVETP